MRAGAGASMIGSCHTVPVNQSAGMRRDGAEPQVFMSMMPPWNGELPATLTHKFVLNRGLGLHSDRINVVCRPARHPVSTNPIACDASFSQDPRSPALQRPPLSRPD